jgi:polar amino acid transport system permease protein
MLPLNLRALAPYLPQLLGGLWLTLRVSAVAVAIELPLGLGGALLRTSRFPVVRSLVAGYVQVLRNVPLLIVLFALFYALPEFGVTLSPFTAGVLGLSLNGSAYTIEIFRGGLAGIAPGQREAASSLGLRPHQVFLYIVFPQLLRISFRRRRSSSAWRSLLLSLITSGR